MSSYYSNDIQKLNALYNRPQFAFVLLYGRFGTGKTSLVREFCQNKRTLFYSAQETVPERQLELFWKQAVADQAVKPACFTSWQQAFTYVSNASFHRRLVLVLDEFSLLDHPESDFMAAFTQAVAHDFPTGRVFLIITCSSLEYIAPILQGSAQTPFDSIHARAQLTSLPFSVCKEHFAQYSPLEQVLLYGVTGGLPSRIALLNPNLSAAHNLNRLFFQASSPLFTEPLTQLHRELREISTYNYLLEIMAQGRSRLIDIAKEAGIGTNKCAKYLNSLISLGIVKKEFPAVGEIAKKVRYIFSDSMYLFWYRFVYPNYSRILSGETEHILEQEVIPALHEYLHPVFESVCTEFLESQGKMEHTPFRYQHAGSWWTGGTKREAFFRIPMVAVDDTSAVLGFCNCSEAPAGTDYLNVMERLPEPIEGHSCNFCIFSTSGFTSELTEKATRLKNVWLIDLDDMNS